MVRLLVLKVIIFFCSVPLWKGYIKRALKEVHFFTKVICVL